jgi:hypothetical protein
VRQANISTGHEMWSRKNEKRWEKKRQLAEKKKVCEEKKPEKQTDEKQQQLEEEEWQVEVQKQQLEEEKGSELRITSDELQGSSLSSPKTTTLLCRWMRMGPIPA